VNPGFISRIIFFAAVAAIWPVSADVLYKLIDKNGKVTYSEEKPKDFDGQVIRLDINPNANTATFPKGDGVKPAEGAAPRRSETSAPKAPAAKPTLSVDEARDRLERAQNALQEARDNPAESDIQILGLKGGGVRMVPTPEYQKKLDRLEQEVKDAEEELRRARES
jgi:hypothetical protein